MKGREDVRGFVDAFSGDNRYIADYLVDEVLQSEPEHVRRFLLAHRDSRPAQRPACDAVDGRANGQAILEDLERRNLFVVALDDRREWYRYHHLFADVLQKQSNAQDPDAARVVPPPGERVARSARVAARTPSDTRSPPKISSAPPVCSSRRGPRRTGATSPGSGSISVKTLPDAVIRARPVLSMGYAWALAEQRRAGGRRAAVA